MKWYAQVRKDGLKREKIFLTKKEAVDWEAEMRRKPVSEWLERTDTTCLADWAQWYLDFARSSFSTTTYKEKRSMFRSLFKDVDPSMPVAKLKPATILSYVVKPERSPFRIRCQQGQKESCGRLELGDEIHGPTPSRPESMSG